MLKSKPLGYVPSDMADANPVTPNLLLMGWLPSPGNDDTDLIGQR